VYAAVEGEREPVAAAIRRPCDHRLCRPVALELAAMAGLDERIAGGPAREGEFGDAGKVARAALVQPLAVER
jgi:hypothetical protein